MSGDFTDTLLCVGVFIFISYIENPLIFFQGHPRTAPQISPKLVPKELDDFFIVRKSMYPILVLDI